jgi:hypothetical protein
MITRTLLSAGMLNAGAVAAGPREEGDEQDDVTS